MYARAAPTPDVQIWVDADACPRPIKEILYRAANILESRAESVARDMTREEGKTLPEARGEVNRAVNILRYYGGEGARLSGQLTPSERDRVVIQTLRRPLGAGRL